MKKIMTLFTILSLQTALAGPDVLIYRFGHMKVAFVKIDGLVVNKACLEKECDATRKGKEFKDAELPVESLVGGKNPKAVRCKELMGGTVVIGLDRKGNEQSFCYFKDDSFLR